MKSKLLLLVGMLFLFVACDKKPDSTTQSVPTSRTGLFYVSNEGAFGYGNASLSVLDPNKSTIFNKAYENVNNGPIGDVLQSLAFGNGKMIMMVNNSNMIRIVDSSNLELEAICSEIKYPRYASFIDSNTIAITSWDQDWSLQILEISTTKILKRYKLGQGSENLLKIGNDLIVCNSGGFGIDSTISIVNLVNQTIRIQVLSSKDPVDVCYDGNNVWVLCKGNITYDANYQPIDETLGGLYYYSLDQDSVLKSIPLPAQYHPSNIEISPDFSRLYVGGGYGTNSILTYDILKDTLSPIIDKYYYGFSVHPESGDLYCLEAPSFVQSGSLHLYHSNGVKFNAFTVGIGPNHVYF